MRYNQPSHQLKCDLYTVLIRFHFPSFVMYRSNGAEGFTEEAICGRPLGMAFDTIGNNLIVADAYYGIWSVDLKTGKKQQLVTPNEELDGEVSNNKFIQTINMNNNRNDCCVLFVFVVQTFTVDFQRFDCC